jgi:tetratricopeptide (TPR) repeat protein
MQKEKLVYGLIGILLGVIVGYIGTDYINQKYNVAAPAQAANAAMGGGAAPAAESNASATQGGDAAAQADVTAIITKARNDPKDFDAQTAAGNLYAQISRYEQAAEFFERARAIKPKDEQTLQSLAAALIGKGDKAAARTALQELERVNPKNETIGQLRSRLK